MIDQAHAHQKKLQEIEKQNAESAADLEEILQKIETTNLDSNDLDTGLIQLLFASILS